MNYAFADAGIRERERGWSVSATDFVDRENAGVVRLAKIFKTEARLLNKDAACSVRLTCAMVEISQ